MVCMARSITALAFALNGLRPLRRTSARSYGRTRLMLQSSNRSQQLENTATSETATKSKQINITHTVTWATADQGYVEFEALDGELLRTAALRQGLVSPHNGRARLINCRGLGSCGTCALEIQQGSAVEPAEKNAVERARLSFPPHSTESTRELRLACQVAVRGDVKVAKRTGFWGQYEGTLANKSEAETYFGEYEFLLDRRSPKA